MTETVKSAAEMYAVQSISLSQLAEVVETYCNEHYCKCREYLIIKAAVDYATAYAEELYTWHEVSQCRLAPSRYTLASFATADALKALMCLEW